jgi:hypothetical protein
MENFKFETLKEKYIKLLSSKISISKEDLTDNELTLINESFELFQEKIDEIKIISDDLKRVNIELVNLKSMNDDSTNDYD